MSPQSGASRQPGVMPVIGYADRIAVTPGARIRFMVSCEGPRYEASIVRLIHGDLNPAGPGFRSEPIASPIAGAYSGLRQEIHPGSYVRIDDPRGLTASDSLTLCCWAFPTRIGGAEQALLGRRVEEPDLGYGLYITAVGDLAFRAGDGSAKHRIDVRTHAPLRERQWYFLACTFDRAAGQVRLYQIPRDQWPNDASCTVLAHDVGAAPVGDAGVPFLIAASHGARPARPGTLAGFFNGRIDRPAVFSRALDALELDALRGGKPATGMPGVLAAWDLAADIATDIVSDASGNRMHGRAINLPTRAVTGHNWTGETDRFADALPQYGAIHFHDDDLEEAGWKVAIELPVPTDWRSGIYALRLAIGAFEDYVPFVVRPPQGQAKSPIAFLAPTLTYLAYANDHMPTHPGRLLEQLGMSVDEFLGKLATPYEGHVFRYMLDNRLNSLYELHSDGSPVCYASTLRPLTTIRPRYNKPNLQFHHPHLLSCDLYLVDWLGAQGFEYDTIDDEAVHEEGESLLARYKVIVTGSHPEYWTWAMLTGMQRYLAGGGRLMYLGGNGFYWVTSIDPARPHVIEIRRGFTGVRTWTSDPGECFHSTTGELGGLWRTRGIPPQAVTGIGFGAVSGLAPARPYRRTAASRDPRAAFIFEDVEDEVLGDFGLHLGGAAGWEIDLVDPRLGTPPHALVVAQSFDHTDAFQRTVEDLQDIDGHQGGADSPLVRADMTYFEGPNGGGVFSVGSISWCGSLSHNGYDNNISRVTGNVLRKFASD